LIIKNNYFKSKSIQHKTHLRKVNKQLIKLFINKIQIYYKNYKIIYNNRIHIQIKIIFNLKKLKRKLTEILQSKYKLNNTKNHKNH
jgi:hypothetical protein